MTDLDRKIAELKGLISGDGLRQVKFHGPLDAPMYHPSWSTDTAKAFELVDEVIGERNDRMALVDLVLGSYTNRPNVYWKAYFCVNGTSMKARLEGDGRTRAEAICRAYIALKEWEKKR